MKYLSFLFIAALLGFSVPVHAQTVSYSDYENDDGRDINFEIIGKMKGNFLVYKNLRWKHKLSIFDKDMNTKEIIMLDFLPEKTLNVDFIAYPDFFYMIYQYQKRNIVHCMGIKMDGDGHKLSEPVELDTTQISLFAENKIYSTINSEDKQKIMVFKIQKKNEKIHLVTLLFDQQLQLIKKSRMNMEFNDRRENYGDFLLDNEGTLAVTLATQPVNRDYSNELTLITKSPLSDSLAFHTVDLQKNYVNEVKLKIDNLNKRYLINAFFFRKNRGTADGMLSWCWNAAHADQDFSSFLEFSDSLRAESRTDGHLRDAFNEFVIRQVVVKKDGGFLLLTEDFSSQTSSANNNLNTFSPYNRYNSFYNPYTIYPNSYYSYNPYYNNYYRPYNSFANQQSTRYFYANIVLMSLNKDGKPEWTRVLHKDQMDDNDDNFLSYSTMISGGEIHFLYNLDRKNQVIADESITPEGINKRNATLKSQEKGYQFMPRLSKQVGANQLLIPCLYRAYICFAKVDL